MHGRSRSRDRSRGHAVNSWSPLALSPALWLRADRGVTLNSGNVAAWADQSGNARHFVQATAGEQPLYSETGGANGRAYVEVGPDRWLSSSAAMSLWGFLHRADSFVWAVVRLVDADPTAVNATSTTLILGSGMNTATGPGLGIFAEDRNAVIAGGDGIRVGTWTTSAQQYAALSSSGALPGATWRHLEVTYAPAAALLIQSNGTLVATALGPHTPQTADPPAVSIGRHLGAITAGTRLRICELGALVGNGAIAQLAALRAYIRATYGVAA